MSGLGLGCELRPPDSAPQPPRVNVCDLRTDAPPRGARQPKKPCRPPACLTLRDRRRDAANLILGGSIRTYFLDAIESLVFSQERTMKKIILVSIAVGSLSTTALADARVAGHPVHHRHLVMGT